MTQYDVLGLGVCSVDDLLYVEAYPPANGKSRVLQAEHQCGGLTANALVAAARLGATCAFAGQLGADALSLEVEQNFRAQGVDVSHVKHHAGAQPVHSIIIVSDGGASRAIFPHRPANYGAAPDWPAPGIIINTRVLFVDHMGADGQIRAATIARAAGIPVVSDLERDESPRFSELLALVNHAIFSHAFATRLTGHADPAQAALALAPGREVTIVTCGGQGCHVVDGAAPDSVRNMPAFKVDVVDTTGCGDVFHGAYAFALAKGMPLDERVRLASAAAALKATRRGGQAGAPALTQVRALMG